MNNKYYISYDSAITTKSNTTLQIYTLDVNDNYILLNNNSSAPYYNYSKDNVQYYQPSTKEILDTMNIKDIEQYLRNKKLETINKSK